MKQSRQERPGRFGKDMKQILSIFFTLSMILMSACSDMDATPSDSDAGSALNQEHKVPDACSPFPVCIVDSAGRTVSFPVSPGRIAAIGQGPFMTTHLLYMFPSTAHRLVGLEQRQRSTAFLPFIDPRFNNKIILQANPGSEQIAALKPDVVFMKGTVADAKSTSLNQVGIPCVYLSMENPEMFLHDVSTVGTILDDEARAQKIRDFYQSRLDTIHDRLKGVREQDKPRVLVLGYNTRGGSAAVQVPAPSWMQTIQTVTAGGRPVWVDATQMTNGWTVMSFEQIAAWNPDKIFLVVWYSLDPAKVISSLKADPQWSMLEAVKNNELHAYPSDIFGWDTPEPRWILGTMWMATRIWPQLFGDIDMTREIYRFFQELYFMPQETIHREIMPLVNLAAGSTHD